MRAILDCLLRRFIVLGRLTVRWPNGGLTTYSGAPGRRRCWRSRTTARSVGSCSTRPRARRSLHGRRAEPVDCSIYEVLDLLHDQPGRAKTSRQEFLHVHEVARAGWSGASPSSTRPAGRGATSPTTTTSTAASIRSSSTATASIPAPISRPEHETLEEAQDAKKRHIASKLQLDRPDLEVLDIGSGWGGLALTLARDCGARVTGITLSREQLAESAGARRRRGAGRARQLRTAGLPQPAPPLRPHRLGRHVRACRRRPLPALLRRGEAVPGAGRRRAAARHRPQRAARAAPMRGWPSTSSPAAIARRCRKCCRRSRSRG